MVLWTQLKYLQDRDHTPLNLWKIISKIVENNDDVDDDDNDGDASALLLPIKYMTIIFFKALPFSWISKAGKG